MPDNTIRDQLAAVIRAEYIKHPPSRYPTERALADALLAAGWRPPAQVITDPAELDALPIGSVVLGYGVAHQACPRRQMGDTPAWLKPSGLRVQTSADLLADCCGAGVTVLYLPTEETPDDE